MVEGRGCSSNSEPEPELGLWQPPVTSFVLESKMGAFRLSPILNGERGGSFILDFSKYGISFNKWRNYGTKVLRARFLKAFRLLIPADFSVNWEPKYLYK